MMCLLLPVTSAMLTLLLMRVLWLCCSAVTLAFLFSKKVTLLRASAYWFCQLTGAILGSSLVYAVRTLLLGCRTIVCYNRINRTCAMVKNYGANPPSVGRFGPADRQDWLACVNRRHQPAAAWHLQGACCVPRYRWV